MNVPPMIFSSTEYLQYTVAYKIPSPHSIDNDQYTVYTVYIYNHSPTGGDRS